MGSKKKIQPVMETFRAPDTLANHPFYGIELDEEQTAFRDAIWDPDVDIIWVNAVAGTGKTTVALGTANLLVKYGRYNKIIYLMAPTAQEKLGHLPGDTRAKTAPYFHPLYDAAVTLGINPTTDINPCTEEWEEYGGGGYIDCSSQVFLRGRNIDAETIIIVDEAQNLYVDELKTVLTRVHDGTKCIVIGHTGQCDLLKHAERSGFKPFMDHFEGMPRNRICELHNNHRGWISRHADALIF